MEWWILLLIIVGFFLMLLAAGIPVFLAFTIVDVIGIYLLWGGAAGLGQLIHSIFSSISKKMRGDKGNKKSIGCTHQDNNRGS